MGDSMFGRMQKSVALMMLALMAPSAPLALAQSVTSPGHERERAGFDDGRRANLF